MHLAFGITTFFVNLAESKKVECVLTDELGMIETRTYDLNGAVNEEMLFLRRVHFTVFILISIANFKECRDLESHYTVALKIIAVILYTGIILKS